MNISFLMDFINPIILGICLIMGYCLKEAFDWFENKYIPLAAACMGIILSIILNRDIFNLSVILEGMISGLSSTGLYEMLRNLIHPKNEFQ